MNKIKKSFALTLALLMALSVMAFPAAACEDEGIMPLYVVRECPECHGTVREGTTTVTPSRIKVEGCGSNPGIHEHWAYLKETPYYCTSCSYGGTRATTTIGSCV